MKTNFIFSSLVLLFIPFCQAQLCAEQKSCCSGTFEHDLCVKGDKHKCYCDSKCLLYGDCCKDYREFCLQGSPEPCIYSTWEPWSRCSSNAQCDVGHKTRKREILQTGNSKSNLPCKISDLSETRRCGDLTCHFYHMSRVPIVGEYRRKHFDFSAAFYQFEASDSGNCEEFKPHVTVACILCDNNEKCGEKVLKENDTLKIWHNTCLGVWRKATDSYYKNKHRCYTFPNRSTYAFYTPMK